MNTVVVITGSSSGIGQATEELLSGSGYVVVGLARSFGAGIQEVGPNIFHAKCDITNRKNVEKTFDGITKRFGRVDVLINNAGSGVVATIEDIGEENIERELSINLKAHIWCIKAAIPVMRQQGNGHIVSVLSTGARLTYPSIALYDAAKHAMLSIVESLSWELKPWNIAITTIEPGAVKTSFGRNMSRPTGKTFYKNYYAAANVGFARMYKNPKTPNQVANVILRALHEKRWRYGTAFVDSIWLLAYKLLPKGLYDLVIRNYFKQL
jgi:NAD(P)-dependent dehydrogenase (short-subunit alcohol dehydrogenase family)